MKRTIIFHKTVRSNKNDLSLYIQNSGGNMLAIGAGPYALVTEDSKLYIKLFNHMLDMIAEKELLNGSISNIEEELLYDTEVNSDIWLPLEVVGDEVSINGKRFKIKAKHLVLDIPLELLIAKFNVSTVTPIPAETPLEIPEHLEDCWVNNMDSLKVDNHFLEDWVLPKQEGPFTKNNLPEYFNVWSAGDSFVTEVKRPIIKEVPTPDTVLVISSGVIYTFDSLEELYSSPLMQHEQIMKINNRCNSDVKALLKISYNLAKDKYDTTNKLKFFYTETYIDNFNNVDSNIVAKFKRINFSPLKKR